MAKPITNRVKMGQTPVIRKDLEGGVVAEANRDGSIYVDKDVKPGSPLEKEAIAHEKVHLNQMNRGDLDYDDKNVYWKGKIYPRSKMNEGAKNLPWEKEAYDKTEHMNSNRKISAMKMTDADLVAGNAQIHKKFTDYGGVINANTPGANTTDGVTFDETENNNNSNEDKLSLKEKRQLRKEMKEEAAKPFESNLKSKGLGIDVPGPNAPTFINPLPMKATPITYKSKNNTPLKQTTAAEEYKAIVDGQYGTVTRTSKSTPGSTTTKSTSTKKAIPQAKGGMAQATDVSKYLQDLRNRFPSATGADLASSKYISSSYVSDYDKMFPSSETTSETTTTEGTESVDVKFTPDKILVKGKEATPGTYNMGFYEARNLNLAAKQKRQTQNRDLRQAKRDYYKALERKTGERVPLGQRKQINPETGLPFDNPKEFMQYRAKARSSYQNKVGKRFGGTKATQDTYRTATAADAPEGTAVVSGTTGLAVIEKAKNNNNAKLSEGSNLNQGTQIELNKSNSSTMKMSSNKNKAPFKMGGYGSKTYNTKNK
jgi:hypothetical protein